MKPGGTGLAVSFWICVALGVAFAPARLLGLATGLVILSGFALAAARIMPLYERLSMWFVPALYLARRAVCRPRRVVGCGSGSRRTPR